MTFTHRFGMVALVVLGVTVAVKDHPLAARSLEGDPTAPYAAGEVLVKFKGGVAAHEKGKIRNRLSASQVRMYRNSMELWRLQPGTKVGGALAGLRGDPQIEYAEPNYLVQALMQPDDPSYESMYALHNTGQTGGQPGADVDAERAWDVSMGSRQTVVAVIDTGIDYTHPDLAPNIWWNPGEIPDNGIDDEGNGFVDDVHGWDFFHDDNDPFDDHGHGTHVAGTIGAVGGNGIGVAGLNWEVSLMALKFLGPGGRGYISGAINALDYATMMGADVSNNSWGGGGYSQALLDAINAAAAADSLFVAAAGNNTSDNDLTPHYPSNYDAPNVVSVAATDHNDQIADFSNRGAHSVDLAAPGVDILSTLPGNRYGALSGTSMATPHVTGAAALIRALKPGMGVVALKQLLLASADPIECLQGITVSGGRLNAFVPIAAPDDNPPGKIHGLQIFDATSNSLFVRWTATGDDGQDGRSSSYDLRVSTSPITKKNFESAPMVAGVPSPGPAGSAESVEVTGLDPATTYYFSIRAKDEWDNAGQVDNGRVRDTTLPAPTIGSSPPSLSVELPAGEVATRSLTIRNDGEGTLDWRIPMPTSGSALAVRQQPLDLGKGEPDPRQSAPVLDGFGGPDSFGYRWLDSESSGPPFTWTDIAAIGTPIAELNGDDQISEPIPLGFSFPFYGATFDSVRVGTNGYLTFTSTFDLYTNQPLPASNSPGNMVAPFWDDLHFRGQNRATFLSDGSRFIVQYTGVDRYVSGSSLTFQVELRRNGAIRYRYLDLAGVTDSATIGIQDAYADDGLTVAFNAFYAHDELEVEISDVPQWLTTASPTSGRLYAGQSVDVTFTVDASELEGGVYDSTIIVDSNDPLSPRIEHPVRLTVSGSAPQQAAPSGAR